MHEFIDTLLNSICHRSDEYAGVLPLCIRCSSVYAGVLVGLVFEILLYARGRRRSGRAALLINAAALVSMGAVGFGRVYGLFYTPAWLTVFVALAFGAAIAHFAVSAIAFEFGLGQGVASRSIMPRTAFLAGLASWAAAIQHGWGIVVRMLGFLAGIGVVTAFIIVNLAFAFLLLRGIARRRARITGALPIAGILIAAEFALFALWSLLHES